MILLLIDYGGFELSDEEGGLRLFSLADIDYFHHLVCHTNRQNSFYIPISC